MGKRAINVMAILMVITLGICFSSCSKNDDGNDSATGGIDKRFVGLWYDKTTASSFIFAWQFDSDGKAYFDEVGSNKTPNPKSRGLAGYWHVSGNLLVIESKGYDEDEGEYYDDSETYRYEFSSDLNTLILVSQSDNWKEVYVRQ